MKARLPWLLLSAFLIPATANADSATERFAAGKLQFEYKNFDKAIELLSGLLYPEMQLTSEDDIVSAREMLGLAYFYTGKEGKAEEEFTALLYLRPKHRLDPFLVPPPAVQFYDSIWKAPAMKAKLEQIERERQAALEAERRKAQEASKVRRIYLERTVTEKSFVFVLLPFGLGQFQNGDTELGIAMASVQGLALLTNMGSWTLRWALQEKGGGYKDPSIAEGLEVAQYASLGVFAAMYIWGVADAWYSYEPTIVEPFQRVREEVEDPKPIESDSGASTSLAPAAYPGGAGLQFEMRF